MKKEIRNLLSLLLCFMLLAGLTGCKGETVEEPETPEPVMAQAEGTLVSYAEGVLELEADGETLVFLTDGETTFSLARGFIAGDPFSVSYEEGSETASDVSSGESSALEPYTLRGTVRAVNDGEMQLALEDGGKAFFSIVTAQLDLWQGLREGSYVELCCLGNAVGGSCVWVQSVTDHDAEGLLTPQEEAVAEEATTEGTTEETDEPTVEEEARAWAFESCEDTVWPSVRANLRVGPGMSYPCVGEAECGEELSRCGLSGDWSAVLIDGKEYYIATELLLTERPGRISTITYDANGGAAAPEAQHKLSGSPLCLSQFTPVREGWHFVSWNTNEKGFGVIFYPGEEYELDGDTTLYAQWEQGEPETATETEAETDTETNETSADAETAEEETATGEEPEPVVIRDSSSAIAGTLVSMEADRLVLEAAGLEYSFDISSASLTAERGVHPGDTVTLYYAGQLDPERGSAAAPAVRMIVAPGEARLSGTLTAVCGNLAALSLGKTELFIAAENITAAVGESVTVTLSAAAADGALVAATVK